MPAFHFYHSLEVGRDLGVTVGREVLRVHFGPQGALSQPLAVDQ